MMHFKHDYVEESGEEGKVVLELEKACYKDKLWSQILGVLGEITDLSKPDYHVSPMCSNYEN